jgi:hypothetical protein
MSRIVYPPWLHLAASVVSWEEVARLNGAFSGATLARQNPLSETLQLRWMVPPYIGLPRKPFTTWIFTGEVTLKLQPGSGVTLYGGVQRINFPHSMAMLVFRLNLTAAGAYVFAYSAAGQLLTGATSEGTTGVVLLEIQNSAIDYVLIGGTGSGVEIFGITSVEFANLPGWIAVETVGLPVDETDFASTSYSVAKQGFVTAPVSPKAAAKRRLKDGAPQMGWQNTLPDGNPAPPFVPPTIPGLLSDFAASVLPNIKTMLNSSSAPTADASVVVQQNIPTPQQAGGSAASSSQPSSATFSPLALLLLASGSDPYNALGLGFGTAYTVDDLKKILGSQSGSTNYNIGQPASSYAAVGTVTLKRDISALMVSCEYDINLLGFKVSGEMADVVFFDGLQLGVTPAPQSLAATTLRLNPPLTVDAPYTATVDATWSRPAPLIPNQTVAASYAVARSSAAADVTLLNAQRIGGGFMPFLASLPADDDSSAPVVFEDSNVAPPESGNMLNYSVAAQDWFGVWSSWVETAASVPAAPVFYASVTDAKWTITDPTSSPYPATLTVLFSWDWTTRRPEEVDLLIALSTLPDPTSPLPSVPAPAGTQYSIGGGYSGITFKFSTDPTVTPTVPGGAAYTVEIVPATPPTPPDGTPPPPMPGNLKVVQYKATIPGFSLNFGGADEAAAFVYAQSKELLSPSWTVTAKPQVARLKSPTPPPVPTCDSIVWATLPDALGVSRVHLRWNSNGAPPSASFHVYEATETGLLDVAGMPPADLSHPYASRLATLRTLNLATCRKTFRKIILPVVPYTDSDFEVELPRGGRILYAYAVTAVSANNIESAFPSDASTFTAVAVPYVEVPRTPRISATLTQGGGVYEAVVKVESRVGVSPHRFVLYRTSREGLSRSVDLMGPPLTDSTQAGWSNTPPDPNDSTWIGVFTDVGVAGSWFPTWYRAVAWRDDHLTDGSGNPLGALGGRSPSSSAFGIVVPPPDPPVLLFVDSISNDTTNETALLAIFTSAPIAATALGSHILNVTVEDPAQLNAAAMTTFRMETALDLLKRTNTVPTSGKPGDASRYALGSVWSALLVWVARPTRTSASTVAFNVTVTLTDPINRSTAETIQVGWWT